MLDKYCCEIKQYCGQDPEKCPIAKRNKDIAELEKAKETIINEIKRCFSWILK